MSCCLLLGRPTTVYEKYVEQVEMQHAVILIYQFIGYILHGNMTTASQDYMKNICSTKAHYL